MSNLFHMTGVNNVHNLVTGSNSQFTQHKNCCELLHTTSTPFLPEDTSFPPHRIFPLDMDLSGG